MITCTSQEIPFVAEFTNGKHTGRVDAPKEKGGGETGFNPQELLEAAVAGCFNIWLRVYSREHGIPLEHITAQVTLDGKNTAEPVFGYSLALQGALTEAHRQALYQAVHSCPIHQILSGKISFKLITE